MCKPGEPCDEGYGRELAAQILAARRAALSLVEAIIQSGVANGRSTGFIGLVGASLMGMGAMSPDWTEEQSREMFELFVMVAEVERANDMDSAAKKKEKDREGTKAT